MAYNISLQIEAILEIREAFEWYEEQKDGLGYELLDEIETCYQNLTDNPLRYSFINPNYRRIKTSRFPYILIYEIEGDDIIINSVRHIKRKPL
ncbi:MAG: type II toxin-antitoxin system RelE/ParE family toxin [Bacteroidetes bacterium]|nr:type II toxin-antitoxin system RelE/ParE family toxin [Bacteroidota bacterium]